MTFDWDEANVGHIALHGVSQAEVEFVLQRPTIDLGVQDWHDEECFMELGATEKGRVLAVITMWRGD